MELTLKDTACMMILKNILELSGNSHISVAISHLGTDLSISLSTLVCWLLLESWVIFKYLERKTIYHLPDIIGVPSGLDFASEGFGCTSQQNAYSFAQALGFSCFLATVNSFAMENPG